MPETQNAPSLRAESVACLLADDSDVPSPTATRIQPLALPGPILLRHWFRGCEMLSAFSGAEP